MNRDDLPEPTDQQLLAQAHQGRLASESKQFIDKWFRDCETTMYAMFREDTAKGAEHWHSQLAALDRLRSVYDHYITTGSIARAELRRRMTPLEQLSRFKWRTRDAR